MVGLTPGSASTTSPAVFRSKRPFRREGCSHRVTEAPVPPVLPEGVAAWGGLQAGRGGDPAPKLLRETEGQSVNLEGQVWGLLLGGRASPGQSPAEQNTARPAGICRSPHRHLPRLLLPRACQPLLGMLRLPGLAMAKPSQPGQTLAQLRRKLGARYLPAAQLRLLSVRAALPCVTCTEA